MIDADPGSDALHRSASHTLSAAVEEVIAATNSGRDTHDESSPPQPRLLDDPNLRRLFGMVLGHRKVLAFALLATAVAAATDPILAKLTGVLTDRALLERDSRSVMWLPLAFVGLFIVRGLASFASSYLLNRISQSVLMNLRMTMFDRMLRWRTRRSSRCRRVS